MKYLFTLVLLHICIVSAVGQKVRFTDTNNQWTFLCISDPTPPFNVYTKTYLFDSSTTYNNQQYLAMETILVREDVAAQKVYARNFMNDTSERVLYDYNLSLSDTFRSKFYNGSNTIPVYCKVTQTDSVTLNNIWHKRWRFQPIDSNGNGYIPFWVTEGMGCTDGNLFYPLMPTATEPTCEICVFRQHTDILYGSTAGCKAGLADPENDAQPVVAMPNPCTATDRMLFSAKTKKGNICFYSMNGQLVSCAAVSDSYIVPGKYLFLPGMYFYVFSDAKGTLTTGRFLFQ